MSGLFGQAGAGGGGGAPTGVVFNAGKCEFDGTTVTPVKEKGQVSVGKSNGMPEFVWRSRESGTADEPVVLLGVTAHVCKSAGADARVFYLNCDAGARRLFFWMQAKDASKDEENIKAVKAVINGEDISAGGSEGGGGQSAIEQHAADLGIDEEQIAILQVLPEEERNQILAQMGLSDHPAFATAQPQATPAPPSNLPPVAATPAVAETPAAPPPVRPTAGAAETPAPAAAAAGPAAGSGILFDDEMLGNILSGAIASERTGANLADILSPEMVAPLMDNEEFVAALLPHLPEGEATLAGLKANVSSPQYAQALQALNSALDSGDLAASMGQFGVDPAVVAAAGGGVLGLCAAIQQKEKESSGMNTEADP